MDVDNYQEKNYFMSEDEEQIRVLYERANNVNILEENHIDDSSSEEKTSNWEHMQGDKKCLN